MAYPTQKEIKDQESAGKNDRRQNLPFNTSNTHPNQFNAWDSAYRRGWDSAGPQRVERGFHNPGF